MAYSGPYRVKNRSKYWGKVDSVTYRSLWERDCFKWCDDNADVIKWCSEEIVVPYYWDIDKKWHRYFTDLYIEFKNGTKLLVEIKPKKETTKPDFPGKRTRKYMNESFTYVKNMNKWEAAEEVARDNGWKFEIWTEDTLTGMGIMKKKLKPLRPMKKMKKPKKKS